MVKRFEYYLYKQLMYFGNPQSNPSLGQLGKLDKEMEKKETGKGTTNVGQATSLASGSYLIEHNY